MASVLAEDLSMCDSKMRHLKIFSVIKTIIMIKRAAVCASNENFGSFWFTDDSTER